MFHALSYAGVDGFLQTPPRSVAVVPSLAGLSCCSNTNLESRGNYKRRVKRYYGKALFFTKGGYMFQPSTFQKMKHVRRALLIPVLCAPLASLADSLALQDYAPYDKSLSVPQAIQAECGLEGKVVKSVQSQVRGFDNVVLVPDIAKAEKGKSLAMKITGISGFGGGAWSGPKNLTIEGTLRENGKVTGTFRATRVSGGGAFGGYRGTCSILERCVKTLGTDVAGWLANPSMNARLGDAN